MSRAVIAVDRLATIIAGLVLIAASVTTVMWCRGNVGLSGPLRSPGLIKEATEPWWPWVVALVGLVPVLLGLRWLVAHVPTQGVAKVRLPGTGAHGRLTADVKSVAQVAAQVLEDTDGVRSSRGTIKRDRGQIVARFTATIEPQADLDLIADAADTVSAQLKTVLQRDDLHCSVNLRVAHRGRRLPPRRLSPSPYRDNINSEPRQPVLDSRSWSPAVELVAPLGELAPVKRGAVRAGDEHEAAHRAVHAALPVRKAVTVEDLARRCGQSPDDVITALGVLELTGLARRIPGEGWSKASARHR